MPTHPPIVLVAHPGEVHLGDHLAHAAAALEIPFEFLDVRDASSGNRWANRFHYHLNGRSLANLGPFSQRVVEVCRRLEPAILLSTGVAPIDASALKAVRELGVRTANFLTDDPFNPVHRARWFFDALAHYDRIFSPRRANIPDLRRAGCREVIYLKWGYAPKIHFPEQPEDEEERNRLASDVFFAGGADRDRIPYMASLIRAGLNVALYGGYWSRFRETRQAARGFADAATVRKAAAAAKVSICLVRRANRDGHSMRTFELPAMRACLAVEDTEEHREIFGPSGEAVFYFNSLEELVQVVKHLLANEAERKRMAAACYDKICGGRNSYENRLVDMLASA